MTRLLFVCTENRLRSATAEQVFSDIDNIDAIGCGTNNDAETPISGDLIEWADYIMVMEKMHHRKVSQKFRPLLKNKRLITLGIADNYKFMEDELVKILISKVSRHIGL